MSHNYSTLVKVKIASAVIRHNERIKNVAREYGISTTTVRRYMDDLDTNIEILAQEAAEKKREELKYGTH